VVQLEGDAVEAVMANAEKLAYELQPMYKELQVRQHNVLQDRQQLSLLTTAACYILQAAPVSICKHVAAAPVVAPLACAALAALAVFKCQHGLAAVMVRAGTWQVHGASKWAAGGPAPAADHSHGERQRHC
jgi:hypothetical protein